MLKEKLRQLRINLGLTQKQIADTLGVDRSTYCYYETGKSQPPLHTITRIAGIYNVSVDNLLSHTTAPINIPEDGQTFYYRGKPLPNNFHDLAMGESDMLIRFRQLSHKEKQKVIQFMDAILIEFEI